MINLAPGTTAGQVSADGNYTWYPPVWIRREVNVDNTFVEEEASVVIETANALLCVGGAATLVGNVVSTSSSITVNKRLQSQDYTIVYNVPTTTATVRLGLNNTSGDTYFVKTFSATT